MNKINLIYYNCNIGYGNFGDELSVFITKKLINNKKYELCLNDSNISTNIICIGSYIHNAKNNYYIFGSGVRTKNNIERGHKYNNLKVYAVRGPLTKEYLENKNIKVPNIFGDPALLLPFFYKPNKLVNMKNKICIIPHKSNYDKYINKNYDSNFVIINPTDKWENIIDNIYSCKCVLSSSLHGLICSDAYDIPNLWLNEYKLQEGEFKFKDYFLSQNRDFYNIQKIEDFKEELLYKKGNTIDLKLLLNSFPFK